MTQKQIIITGGFGFIGSRFTLAVLKNTTYNVKIIDKLTYAADKKRVFDCLDTSTLLAPDGAGRLSHIEKDINDVTPEDIQDADYIVNFAAESHVDNSISDGRPFIKSNIEGVFNLLECARTSKALKKFFQISTDEVYGDMYDLKGHPAANETFKLRPSSYYSASKAAADLLVQSAARTFGIKYLITRTCNNFGPNQDSEKFLPKLIKSIKEDSKVPVYGDGLQSREWIHVDDNALIILELLLSSAEDEVYNVGSGYHYKNIEIVNYVGEVLGKEVKRAHVKDRLGHDKVYKLDNAKVASFLGEKVFQCLEGFLKDEVKG
jgi:dTDP-glucose 4,6-dehydratase